MSAPFWTEHWWAIPAWLLGVVAMVVALARARRDPQTWLGRIAFWLFPPLDPDRRAPSVRLRLLWLVFVVMVLVLAFDR